MISKEANMSEIDILEEIVTIQKKYLTAVESMGTLSLSPQDRKRIDFLEDELKKVRAG